MKFQVIVHMLLWDDQHMNRGLWTHIIKGNQFRILIKNGAGYLFLGYTAEETMIPRAHAPKVLAKPGLLL